MKKMLIIIISLIVVTIVAKTLLFSNTKNYEPYEQIVRYKPAEHLRTTDNGMDFIFTQDYKMPVGDVYSGGDFPIQRKFISFKKGDIIQGNYATERCIGNGCVPTVQEVLVDINNQIRPIDISILSPVIEL